jgi:hypothetical protein
MDSFYLNLAVYYLEDFLEHRTNPYYAGSVTYGRPKKPHGWQPMTDAELASADDGGDAGATVMAVS